ncbi:hypothetical protein [Cellulomonas xiejunii]|uniref:Ig-like domain-containing protein n=1 Tax=Cellulomonas xiejunii TaxID=2968083 RepID=A0ABY5KV71_9CELL|nr:hypothetical protein [Cellulomonas xiejunii]MCC2321843.1 hypothetical protein [Cellulomonas xiejunii]UUI73147.1 hypothetical protein NP048_06840 [Cellulomonas xiejunii]
MRVPEPLRGLSRGMQAFVLLDVLLVVVLVVVFAATLPGGGGSDDAAAATTTTSTPTAGAGDGEAPPSDETVAFTLPSGNIACEMGVEGVLCSIRSFTYAPPQVTGCEAETGHLVRLDGEGFGFVCEDDDAPRVVTDGPELTYGQRETVGGYTCASGTDGVTCTDAGGIGFRLARAQWDALP